MKELQLDDKLNFVEEPVEITDQEVKKLKLSRIPIVKGFIFIMPLPFRYSASMVRRHQPSSKLGEVPLYGQRGNYCIDAFETLKKKLTEAPILVVPDWNLPFELMSDASDFMIGVVLGQRKTKHIHYGSKTMTEAQIHYTTTEKEMLAVVYAFEKFRPYLVLSKNILYTNHSAIKYLLNMQDTKPRLIRRSNRRCIPHIVEPEIRTIAEIVPMADRTMEELLQAPTEGYGEAIVILEILAENFEIKTNLLQLVQANKFHGFERDNPHTHISNFKRMTATLKYRDVLNDAIKLMLFPYSLEGAARIWDNVSKTDDRIDKLADQISNLVEIVNKQVIAPAKAVEKTCVTCGGAHAYDCIATNSNQSSVCAATGSYNQVSPPNRACHKIPPPGFALIQPSTSGTLPSNTVPNPKGEMKAVTTCSGLAYEGPSIPTESPLEKVDEQNTKEILDKEHSNSSGSIAQVQPPVVPILIPKPDVSRTQTKPTILYPSRLNDQKLREKATNQMEKFFQNFHDLHFDISFADALLLNPKFTSTIKSLLANKDKFFELAKVPLNENCSAMLLKKLPEKLGDLELTPTGMALKLADRLITHPKGVAEDVFVKVGKFHFLTDFVVVDFEADPRVPLILGRSFLRTGHALIDVYGEEITLRVNDEFVTFNLNQVMRYSDNSVSRVNVINIACEEFVQDNTKSSNPTLVSGSESCKEPILKSSLPTLTPFGECDFFLEEIEDFLNDDLIPTGIENYVYDPEGDILYFENLLKEYPFHLLPMNLNQAKTPIKEPEYSLNNESEYVVPINDDSSPTFTNPLFNDKDDFTIPDKDVPIKESKAYLNLFFDDDEINSDETDPHCLNVESNFVESLSNHDTLKFDFLEEFSGALMSIRIADEERIRREHAEYISLIDRLITINPYPRPMENSNMIVESLPSSLIGVQDNDSQREEIDIVTDTDELLPPGFENDDSEGEIYVLEELRVNNSIPNSKNELSNNEASDLMIRLMNNIDELIDDECFDPGKEIDILANVEDNDYFPFIFFTRIFLPYLIYLEVSPLLLSVGSEYTIFDPRISV
nr:reverse transcriptase domain-containing protein [Tanacetum cinerariifolium]